jgi:hypothetical protein
MGLLVRNLTWDVQIIQMGTTSYPNEIWTDKPLTLIRAYNFHDTADSVHIYQNFEYLNAIKFLYPWYKHCFSSGQQTCRPKTSCFFAHSYITVGTSFSRCFRHRRRQRIRSSCIRTSIPHPQNLPLTPLSRHVTSHNPNPPLLPGTSYQCLSGWRLF